MNFHNCLQTIAALLLLLLSHCASAQESKNGLAQPAIYQQKMQSSTLLFMENKGQVADDKGNPQPDILYTASSGGAKIYLTATGIHYQFSKTDYPKGYDPYAKEPGKDPQQEAALRKQIKTSTHRFTVELQGANPAAAVMKQGQSNYYENYYLPQCPNGITDVHGYEKITFRNVYPNIDWVVYSKGGFMEYDFLVHPGGKPASIKLKIKDADNVSITPQGELLIKTSLGEVKEKAPVSFADGRMVPSRFKQNADGTIGFAVQAPVGEELRIDPSIVWSTYYGGTGHEGGCKCTTDNNGQVYLTGITWSTSSIASGGFQNTYGGGFVDAFLVKFDNAGSRLWSTYYGGNAEDYAGAISVDATGNILLAGSTQSTTGIASGGFQMNMGSLQDAFLVKFNSSGNRLWATYYGGSGTDNINQCVTDAAGNIFVTGFTNSPNSIASGGFQNTYGGSNDAYLVKFNPQGSRMWGTYYGGNGNEAGYSCCVDNTGAIYMSGNTESAGLSFQGYKNSIDGSSDNYLVKFSNAGVRQWATYYGGNSFENDGACTTDPAGNVYLSGITNSTSILSQNGYQNTPAGNTDIYLVKFTDAGSRLWATYCGGSDDEGTPWCVADAAGNIYLGGNTLSSNNIASNPLPGYQTYKGGYDGFVQKLTSSGSRLWGTYFGGSSFETCLAGAVDNSGNIYVSGHTGSQGLAINGFQNTLQGGPYDGYLVKIGAEPLCISATQPTISATNYTFCIGNGTTLSIASGNLNSATTWQWRKDSCNGATVGTGTSINVSPTATTTYFVKGEGGCAAPGNCTSKTITVNPVVTPTITLTATPSGTLTAGTPVIFTATPTNGGNVPFYAFKVNGLVIQNGPGNTFNTNTLVNGDIVTVTFTSNASCVSNITATSNAITVIVAAPCIAPTTPTISTNYDTVCTGATPTLTIASGNLNSATRWQWYTDSCGGTLVGNTTSITFTPTITTTYYVRGEGGCVTPGTCVSKTIYVKPKPVVTFTATPSVICPGDTTTVLFTGTAPANASYNWNWGGGTVVSGIGAGPYKVVYNTISALDLTVNNGTCNVAATQQTISMPPKPTAAFEMSDTIGCGQLSLSVINKSINTSSWYWSFGDNAVSTDSNPQPHSYLKGLYTISLKATNGNCSHTTTRVLRVVDKPLARFVATPSTNSPVPLSQAIFSFSNTSTNASRYQWHFGDLGTSLLTSPTHQYLKPGFYTVKLLAYSSPLCVDSFELKPVIILADTVAPFTIPNAFSPNGDGINDKWMVAALQQSANCRVTVYNRWGQVVFTSINYSKAWDGNFNGKALPVDTYYYVITVGNKSYNGSVMLLR